MTKGADSFPIGHWWGDHWPDLLGTALVSMHVPGPPSPQIRAKWNSWSPLLGGDADTPWPRDFPAEWERVTLNKSSHRAMSNGTPGCGRSSSGQPCECCGYEVEKARPWPRGRSQLLGDRGTQGLLDKER